MQHTSMTARFQAAGHKIQREGEHYFTEAEGRRVYWYTDGRTVHCIEGCLTVRPCLSFTLCTDWRALKSIKQALYFLSLGGRPDAP